MLEFMACGRPVVLGVDGYARTVLERADAGVFVEPENDEALATAIVRLARDPELCAKFGENGRRFVSVHFSRASTAQRYLEVLETLVAGWRRLRDPRDASGTARPGPSHAA